MSRDQQEETMDKLGDRIVADQAQISFNRTRADEFERQAKRLREEANEIERLLELARQS